MSWVSTSTLLVSLSLLLRLPSIKAAKYNDTKTATQTLLDKSRYDPTVRPLLNQDDILEVYFSFEFISIVELDDVRQTFMCNGYLVLFWTDELLRWDPNDYGGVTVITPKLEDVFKPRLVLGNTIGERDVLKDEDGVVKVYASGFTSWIPGSSFETSCKMDLAYYPFDEQYCSIDLVPLVFGPQEIYFYNVTEEVSRSFYVENGEWDVVSAILTVPFMPRSIEEGGNVSSVVVLFHLKRKPVFLVVSILLPIIFLSLLNLLVFLIPVDSGEKISYGITVLLALSVFMSITSAMLPRSSESMPVIISYIFSLLAISVLTVVDSIIIVKLHHMEEKEASLQRAKKKIVHALPKMKPRQDERSRPYQSISNVLQDLNRSNKHLPDFPAYFNNREPSPQQAASPETVMDEGHSQVNKYKMVGKYIDIVSLVIFSILWLGVTLAFIVIVTVK